VAAVAVAPAARPVTPKRYRTALHEAGHAVAGLLLGGDVDGIKLDPAVADVNGVCFNRFAPLDTTGSALAGSFLLIDRDVRDRLFRECVVLLAGGVCVELYGHHGDGYRAEPATAAELERMTEALEDAGYREAVERFESGPLRDDDTDAARLFRIGELFMPGSRCASSFLRWILAETVALARSQDFRRPLAALTEQLLRHGELPAAEVHRVFHEATDERWERHANEDQD